MAIVKKSQERVEKENAIYFGEKNSAGAVEPAVEI